MLYHYVHQFLILIHFLLPAAFFVLFAFFVPVLRVFFAAGAALLAVLDDGFEAAAVDDDVEAALDAVDFLAFDAPAAFFFGDAARFFGLLALPADFVLPALDFGLADLAFFAPVDAFFLPALAAGAAAAGAAVAAVESLGAAAVVGAAFFTAFFGEAERFRLVPVADFGLLDERAVFGLAALGVFDRLRLGADLLPADEPLALLADFFLPPARKAALTCLLAVAELTLKLADEVVCDVLSDGVPLGSVILVYLRSECVYEYEAKKKKKSCVRRGGRGRKNE